MISGGNGIHTDIILSLMQRSFFMKNATLESRTRRAVSIAVALLWQPALALADAAALSEKAYLSELPVVLTVSRLAQPQSEAPAAVTVIDREMIRRSGAREVADLLRLVPGFIVSHFNGGARPYATYHADFDAYNRHLQVYVDGRSLYSGLIGGSGAYGLMGVALDDIERIEVIRGSNSASQGANAFLGVLNIVTRHAADTQGVHVSASSGQDGLADQLARVGWTSGDAAFRLTASQRKDHGYDNLTDDKSIRQVSFRGDVRLNDRDSLLLTANYADFDWGDQETGTPLRTESWRSAHAQLRWSRVLDASSEIRASAYVDEEQYSDFFPLYPAQGDGKSSHTGLEWQHNMAVSPTVRMVYGVNYRGERVNSPYLFYAQPQQNSSLWQLLGNVEWRVAERWLINLGGMEEHHNELGSHFAPRAALNYLAMPGQTLRFVQSRAFKVPTAYELHADWRYKGVLQLVRASGIARPERIDSTEIGYLGEFPALNLSVDVRAFNEDVDGVIRYYYSGPTVRVPDIGNSFPNRQRGWETQLRWQPQAGTELLFNFTQLKMEVLQASSVAESLRAPQNYSTLALHQRLPWNMDLNLTHTRVDKMFFVSVRNPLPAYGQTDVRLAKKFNWDKTAAEVALTIEAVGGGHYDFRSTPQPVYLGRRAFVTLTLDL
jgi:iron complex outermembrane receptor protein